MINYFKNAHGLEKINAWAPNCWVSCELPDQNDKSILINDLKIPEDYFNDIEDIDERPRIEYEDGWYLIIIRIPYNNENEEIPFTTVPLGIIFKDDILVSVCFYKTELLPDFITYTQRKNRQIKDNFDLALKLLLSSSVWFLKYLKQINHRVKIAEEKLEKSIQNEDLQTLLLIGKCLVYYNTSLKGNDILIYRLKNLKDYNHTFDTELLEDVEIELKQAIETTHIYSDILSNTMDAYASVISNNLNVIMKQLTSISIILMIPTLIASFYGMNVPNFLENNMFGLWIILLISFIFSGLGVFVFMKRKWF